MGAFLSETTIKEMAGSKEPDFVEKAPNTCPNLCVPINYHGSLWSTKMVNKGKEREQRGWEG